MPKVTFNTYSLATAPKVKASSFNPKVVAVMIAIFFVIIALWLVSNEKKKGNDNDKVLRPPLPPTPRPADGNNTLIPMTIPNTHTNRITHTIK